MEREGLGQRSEREEELDGYRHHQKIPLARVAPSAADESK